MGIFCREIIIKKGTEKTKFNDNRLAEELDLIVMKTNRLALQGLPKGSLGTLTLSYTGPRRKMYALFDTPQGKMEYAIFFSDFRVLNEKNARDLAIMLRFMQKRIALVDSCSSTSMTSITV